MGLKTIANTLLADQNRNLAAGIKTVELSAIIRKLDNSLFKQQKKFIKDKATRKVICCTRRAGKTQALIRYLLLIALKYPGSELLYLATSSITAKRLVWEKTDGILTIIQQLGISNFCELSVQLQAIKFHNGSILYVSGCENKLESRKWNGFKWRLCVLDESQDWADDVLEYTVEMILTPATIDMDGTICLAGIPGPVPAGYFFNAYEGIGGWKRHHWTLFENKKMKNQKSWFKKQLKLYGLDADHPISQRSYFGKWVKDDQGLLFHYHGSKQNVLPENIPNLETFSFVLAVDPGVVDKTGFAIIAYNIKHPFTYILESMTEKNADPERVGEIVRVFIKKYPGLRVVCDELGLGKGFAEHMRRRMNLPIEAAENRRDKAVLIRFMNDAMRLGTLRVLVEHNKELIKAWNSIEIDHSTGIEKKHAKLMDVADAAFYGWSFSYSFLYVASLPPKERTSLADRIRNSTWVEDLDARLRADSEKTPQERQQELEYEEIFENLKF